MRLLKRERKGRERGKKKYLYKWGRTGWWCSCVFVGASRRRRWFELANGPAHTRPNNRSCDDVVSQLSHRSQRYTLIAYSSSSSNNTRGAQGLLSPSMFTRCHRKRFCCADRYKKSEQLFFSEEGIWLYWGIIKIGGGVYVDITANPSVSTNGLRISERVCSTIFFSLSLSL